MSATRSSTSAPATGFAPRDVPHTYRVESDGARWLTVGAPGGLDRYFLAIGRPAAGALPGDLT